MPWNEIPSYRTSPPEKNAFSWLSVARVSTMPRRISRRSSGVSDAVIDARRRKPSQASTSSSRAAASRAFAVTPGVVSASPAGAAFERRDVSSLRSSGRSASIAASSAPFWRARPLAASNASRASVTAKG